MNEVLNQQEKLYASTCTIPKKGSVCQRILDFVAEFEYGQRTDRARPSKNIQSRWVWPRSNKHDILAPQYQNKPDIRAS